MKIVIYVILNQRGDYIIHQKLTSNEYEHHVCSQCEQSYSEIHAAEILDLKYLLASVALKMMLQKYTRMCDFVAGAYLNRIPLSENVSGCHQYCPCFCVTESNEKQKVTEMQAKTEITPLSILPTLLCFDLENSFTSISPFQDLENTLHPCCFPVILRRVTVICY